MNEKIKYYYLTWYVACVERRRKGDIKKVTGRGVDVYVEEIGVALEESLPEGNEGQGSSCEEHEGDFGYSSVGVFLFVGDQ